jgi:two-component system, chemotaxis family, chemotaxis protein CheY
MVTSNTIRTRTTPHEPSLDFAPVILVVDDERQIRELCRELLGRDFLRVVTAANGIEALELADRWILDVLVTDVAMPGLDGFGLLRALRCRYPGMAAFVMTGDPDYHGRPVQEVAVELGVNRTFLKPFDPMHLCEAVKRQCEVSGHFVVAGTAANGSIPGTPGQTRAGSMLAG